MSNDPNGTSTHPVTTSLERLSIGIDRILDRWTTPNRPRKLSLLNDLASAIHKGSDWGALKHASRQPVAKGEPATFPRRSTEHIAHIPMASRSANVLPARLFAIPHLDDRIAICELADDARSLFSMSHDGDPILGLDLQVWEGNGEVDVSIFARLILLRAGSVVVEDVDAWEMNPEIARLVYCAVQNLQRAPIYNALAQLDCFSMHIILGPFDVALAIPDGSGRAASRELPTQGVRILIDEGSAPEAVDLDVSLRLLGAALPALGFEGFPRESPVRFQISQQREKIWSSIGFEIPNELDHYRSLFRRKQSDDWVHSDLFVLRSGHQYCETISEALDLSLALVDVDAPDLFLHVRLAPVPSSRGSSKRKPGWRGGIVEDWRVVRLEAGLEPQVLSLDHETNARLARGINGWAMHEGYSIGKEATPQCIEALVPRSRRRASRHMEQVRAIINGADPLDTELIGSFKIK